MKSIYPLIAIAAIFSSPLSIAQEENSPEVGAAILEAQINEDPHFEHNQLKALIGDEAAMALNPDDFVIDFEKLKRYLERSPQDQKLQGLQVLKQAQLREAQAQKDQDGPDFARGESSSKISESLANLFKMRSIIRSMRRAMTGKSISKERAERARVSHHPEHRIPLNADHVFHTGIPSEARLLKSEDWHAHRLSGLFSAETKAFFDIDLDGRISFSGSSSGSQEGINFNYGYAPVYFGPFDYVNYMDELWATVYAPIGTEYIQVDFDYIDIEPGYDVVTLYDRYGECDSFSGSYGSFRMSTTCVGDYVDFWIETDGSVAGESYDGFSANGIWYREGYDPPVAIATANNYTPRARDYVYFYGDLSFDPEFPSSYLDYYWTFGDGTTSRSKNPAKIYDSEGAYRVSLRVCNDTTGLCDTDTFTIDVQIGYADAFFTFRDNPIGDDTDAVVRLRGWNQGRQVEIDWGDGNIRYIPNYVDTSTGRSYNHRYATGGFYNVVVTVTNELGSSVHSRTLEVITGGIPPYIRLSQRTYDIIRKAEGRKYKIPSFYAIFSDDNQITGYELNWGSGLPGGIEFYDRAALARYFRYDEYGVLSSYEYRDPATRKKLAGVYEITATAFDNNNASSSVSVVFTTPNKAPKVSGSAIVQDCSQAPSCTFSVRQDQPFEKLFKDKDGRVVGYTFSVKEKDKVTKQYIDVPGCPAVDDGPMTCTFPELGKKYYVFLTGEDNVGATGTKKKKVKLPKRT